MAGERQLIPLCVDLDGTLTTQDTLACLLMRQPFRLPGWLGRLLLRGKAPAKAWLSEHVAIQPERFPYRQEVITWLRQKRAQREQMGLVTGAHRRVAEAVAAHLGGFDFVLASDEQTTLVAAAKAQALVQRFGSQGFDYAGNERRDLHIWRVAAGAVLVDVPPGVEAAASATTPILRVFHHRRLPHSASE